MHTETPSGTSTLPALVLTTAEAAQVLKVSVKTLLKMTNRDTDPIPHFRQGHVIRFRLQDLQSWLDRQIAKGA